MQDRIRFLRYLASDKLLGRHLLIRHDARVLDLRPQDGNVQLLVGHDELLLHVNLVLQSGVVPLLPGISAGSFGRVDLRNCLRSSTQAHLTLVVV